MAKADVVHLLARGKEEGERTWLRTGGKILDIGKGRLGRAKR